MSGILEMAEELYSCGLTSGVDKNVCKNHFADNAVRRFITNSGDVYKCDYCNRSTEIVPVENLMKFLMETVSYFYSDPVEFAPYNSKEGGYLVPNTDAWEILTEYLQLDVDNYALSNDMMSWIDFCRSWADQNELYSEGHYARPDSWSHFSYLVKHQVRYLFPAYHDNSDRHSHKPLEILEEVGRMVKKYKLVSSIKANTEVFRCRQHYATEIISGARQMCSPEIEYCIHANRMSPAGVSMFYCAFEANTSLKETIDQTKEGSNFSIVKFALNQDIRIIDLSKIPPAPSVFDTRKRERLEDLIFLRSFVDDLSKPFEKDGKVHIEYVPTQIVTEFFRYMQKQKVDGIIYPSARNHGYNSIVLFYDHSESLDKLTYLSGTLKTHSIDSYHKVLSS